MFHRQASSFRDLLTAAFCVALVSAAPSPPPQTVPRRIVSLNMCADQLIIALADPGQIAGLTEWARDPALSYYAARARALPFTHRSAEEVMALHPDLVIGVPFRTKAALQPLKASGVPIVEMPAKDGLAGIDEAIGTIAAAVGHPDRGTAMIAQINKELSRIGPPPGRGRVAAFYQRQGYLTGSGTLVDEMMRRVGLVNLATKLGRPAFSQIGLEQMALARPDFLVMDDGTRVAHDRGSDMLHHPLLTSAVPQSHHLYLPQAMTVCGTPAYPRAVAMLAAEIRAADTHATR